MKISTPIVTLIVGVLIALVIVILSVRAKGPDGGSYGSGVTTVVLR